MTQHLDPFGRPLSTAAQRLQFAVRFVRMDLDTLRAGDWLNLQDDLQGFLLGAMIGEGDVASEPLLLAGGNVHGKPTVPPYPWEYPEADFRQLHEGMCTLLEGFVHGVRQGTPVRFPLNPGPGYNRTYMTLNPLDSPQRRPLLVIEGSTRDVVLDVVGDLLLQGGGTHILPCPECGKIFYRVQKQLYCSKPCVNRANHRTWRERQGMAHAPE